MKFNILDNMLKCYNQTDEYKSLLEQIQELNQKVKSLEEKYAGALQDIKHLEEENIETSNCLYELINSIDAVDARIDIITIEKWGKDNV